MTDHEQRGGDDLLRAFEPAPPGGGSSRAAAAPESPSQGAAAHTAGPVGGRECWFTADGTTAAAMLSDLREWVRDVYSRYGPAERGLRPCWMSHPGVVEELLTLRETWRHAYGPSGSADDRAWWHERWLPGVVRRLGGGPGDRGEFAECDRNEHQNRRELGRPYLEHAGDADLVARWWVAHRDEDDPGVPPGYRVPDVSVDGRTGGGGR